MFLRPLRSFDSNFGLNRLARPGTKCLSTSCCASAASPHQPTHVLRTYNQYPSTHTNAHNHNPRTVSFLVVRFVMDTTNALASVDQLLALRMHLMCALTADKCGKDDVAYDMVSQAFVL